jgi:cob(I)alamin adenosyltransferase
VSSRRTECVEHFDGEAAHCGGDYDRSTTDSAVWTSTGQAEEGRRCIGLYSAVVARADDEPVRLTRIYTRGGDAGETSLGDGTRVSKLDGRIASYGTVDELNAVIGVVLAGVCPDVLRPPLARVQNELFDLGADLAVPVEIEGRLRITQAAIDELERLCDHFNADLGELKSFVLPGGTSTAAALHVARTVCRRAERDTLAAAEALEISELAVIYLNRLSDLLFILARVANASGGQPEPLWTPGSGYS